MVDSLNSSLIRTYLQIDDLDNAKKTLETLKKAVPNYFNLTQLEKEIEIFMFNHGLKNN